MRVEQRQQTTIDLHDGKARSYLVQEDPRGWKLTAVSKDDVLHLVCAGHDLERMRQEIMKSNLTDYWKGHAAHADCVEPLPDIARRGRSLIRVDQRAVTTVRLPRGNLHDCSIQADERGYRIVCATRDEAVHIYLPAYDLYRLRDALRPTPTPEPIPRRRRPLASKPEATEWLAYN